VSISDHGGRKVPAESIVNFRAGLLNVLVVWFDEAALRRCAGNTWYVRGVTYVEEVGDLCCTPTTVTATVQGTDSYEVRLSGDRGGLDGECSCPVGRKGDFCKHCVAVGLAALAAPPCPPHEPAPATPAPAVQAEDEFDLRPYLLRIRAENFDPDALDSIVDALKRSRRLGDVALAKLSRAAAEVLHLLDRFAADHPAAIRPLYQRALRHLTAPNFGGQPDNKIAPIRAAMIRAMEGLIAVSRAEPPDPIEFGRWLIDLQIGNVCFPEVCVGRFAEILGEEGLAAYGKQLSDLAARASTYDGDDATTHRQAIFRLRESYLVGIVKDVDRLVELYAEALSRPERYVRIGEALRDAERFDEAIDWLQRGLADTRQGRTDICDLLVAVYTQLGRLKEAARARLDHFNDEPDVYNYRMLMRAAEAVGAASYAHKQAMTLLRERAACGQAADPLIGVLLSNGEIDEAWAAAQEFECSDTCGVTLASSRAKQHPADAIPIYSHEVEKAIARKHRSGYQKAVELLVSLRDLHERAGRDFGAYMDELRSTHSRKDALMECLAAAGL
jgi:uncharacterized Zn finger protein